MNILSRTINHSKNFLTGNHFQKVIPGCQYTTNNIRGSLYEYEPLSENIVVTAREQNNYFVFGDKKVGEILEKKKDNEIVTVGEHELIINAIRKMVDKKIGSILVVNSENKLKGIFSERDYLSKVNLAGLSSRESPVEQVMTKNVKTIKSDTCTLDAMKIMTTKKFRHLPVVDNNKHIIGVVSIQDLINSVHSNQKETIKYLREFISDSNSYSLSGNFKNDGK
ncbi:hypothetical protein DFA_01534 [Cavenderia fasciculata]|uniref:CBS domain-containing protein n=1 Tax=Cavenderia fasciculata TaxID=261658 RepID=F4PTC6_CACFS|nr:uncharacterized protein DFA_01534 [Cavenderia fasciculata]EGG21648.1 hypothetical protein DFA_01534 [Cavenderia fasciculata]|eukprot:XP_004359498.1 hypothetical protein DFA_01534 [Cavenderia fasciculata]